LGCRARNHESTSPRVDETQADGGIMVRARGVSVRLLGRAGDSHPPVLHWGTAPARVGFRAEVSRRMAVKRHGPDRGGRGPSPSSSSRRPLACRGRATGRPGPGRARSSRSRIFCADLVLTEGPKQPHAARNRARGLLLPLCRVQAAAGRIGSDGRHHAEAGRDGTGTWVRPPPPRSLIGWPDARIARCPTQARTHASTPPADVLND
jgi:hypothetical protein